MASIAAWPPGDQARRPSRYDRSPAFYARLRRKGRSTNWASKGIAPALLPIVATSYIHPTDTIKIDAAMRDQKST